MPFTSTDDFTTRKLEFTQDANGVFHLAYNPVSRAWLKKNKAFIPAPIALVVGEDLTEVMVYNCVNLNLTGTEFNNLELSDVEGGI
jgi:hypothetical protein